MTSSNPPSRSGVSSSLVLGAFAIAWAAVISLAAVPWYLRLLGIENYGLIGFFATLQAAISLLDLGLGATINREVARSSALDELDRARRLLRSLEYVYAGAAIVIALVLAVSAPLIASRWLGPSRLDHAQVIHALQLMAVVAALRWPTGLYLGTLIGLHRAQISYRINATMATVVNVGAILILVFVQRSLWAYFAWQALLAVANVAWARSAAWQALGRSASAKFDRTLLKGLLKQSAMMSGVAMSGLVLTQLDKFVVSSSVPLGDFGRYSLASVLATGLSILIIPTFNVIYPRLSALVAANQDAAQVTFYRLGTRLFLAALAPLAFSAFYYAYDALVIWTANPALALTTAPIAQFLFLGSALNGLMLFPYAMQLAKGRTRLPFVINCILIIIMLPLAVFLVRTSGALGGAITWFTLNLIFVFIGSCATHKYILPGLARTWLLRDVAPSIVVSGIIVSVGAYFGEVAGGGPYLRIAIGTLFAVMAAAILLLANQDSRGLVRDGWLVVRQCRARGRVGATPETGA